MKKSAIIILIVLIVGSVWLLTRPSSGGGPANATLQTQDSRQAGFDKKQLSLDNPASIWVIVNKQRPLQPKKYAPSDLVVPNIPLRLSASSEEMQLRKPAADALKKMYDAARADRIQLMVSSAYRSYIYQDNLYNYYVKQQGQTTADTQSARPGHSEHQTGLAVDVEPASRTCEVQSCFADAPEGIWVAKNAYKYGFVIRYLQGKQDITGYIFEPWHLRYVGIDLASELQKNNYPTLEEYFKIPAAPNYR